MTCCSLVTHQGLTGAEWWYWNDGWKTHNRQHITVRKQQQTIKRNACTMTGRKSISETRQVENNRPKHTTWIQKEMLPTLFPVYLPYSFCVLQRAGRTWPWLKNDTHGPTFCSTSTATCVKSKHTWRRTPHPPLGHLESNDRLPLQSDNNLPR